MSIPGVPGDRASYDVIYRARWDGTELTEGAAKARAEIDALQKANSDYNRQASQESRDAAAAARTRADAEKQLTAALRSQEQARLKLNIAEDGGFATPEQYYQYKQREIEQQKVLNKVRNNGRDTPDQVVADIKNETTAVQAKAQQVSRLAVFFDELANAQERANTSDPFAGRATAQRNLKSYADEVRAVIDGLQSAVQRDPFANGTALKKATLNVQSFVDSIKTAITEVNNEVDNIGTSVKGKSGSSFFSSFSNTTKDINRGLKGISENAKKAAEDGGKSASDLDIAWTKFKYTLNAVGSSASNIFSGGAGGGGGGFGGFFAAGAAAGGSFLSVLSAAIPAVTSLWGILGLGVAILPLIISGVLALATGVIGLTASIGTLVVGAGAVIPIFIALAGAAVVLKEAVQPVVKAVTALGNATTSAQVQAALKGLSPSAQAAALALNSLRKAFTGDVQQAFWKPLLPALKNIGEVVKPVTKLFDLLAGSVGNFLNKALTGFENFAQSSGFKTLTNGAVETINNLGGALLNLFDVVTKLAVAGQPITNFLTGGIDNLSSSLDKLITTAQNNGSLNKFFDSVLHRMMLIGNIFSNVFGGMHNLFVDFLPVGDAFLQEIDGWAKRFDAFSKNKTALTEWAKDAIPFLKSLGDLLASIVSGIVRLGSNPQNLKDLTDIFQGIGKVVGPLFNLMQALFDLFSRFAAVAAPLIGSALSGFARAIQDVANWVRDIENNRYGIDALKTLLGIFGGLVVSASLVNFVGKLIALAGSSWSSLKTLFGFFRFGSGGGSSGGGDGGGPAQAAADTQLKAAQINLTASENNLRAAGLMGTAATENVGAADEMGAAVVGGSGGGKSFGKGLLGALTATGGILTLIYGNQAVNSGTAPNTGGRLAGEAGTDVLGGALVGGSMGGLTGAVVGGVIGGVKAIFDNGSYIDKILNAFNPNANAQKNLYNGPSTGYLTPKGTPVDPVTGLPTAQFGIATGGFNGVTITPEQLGSLMGTYNSQVPSGKAPSGTNTLPPAAVSQPKTQFFLQPQQQPGDPRANPNFGYGSQDKPIISANFLNPVVHFFTHDIEQWSKDGWHAVQNFFTGPFVRFFTDTIPHAASAFWRWFVSQNKDIWNHIKDIGLTAWHGIIDPVWQWFDRDVYRPVEKFVMHTLPNFFTQTIPKWWDAAYGWFMRYIGSPVANFITKTIPGFFTQTVPKWWDAGYSWFMRDIGSPIANFITKTIPSFFTQTIPKWFDSVGGWFSKSVINPISDFFSKTLPSAVEGGFRNGLNWVIRNVIGTGNNPTSGIIGLINKATGVVGVHIPGIPTLNTGGKVPGPDYVDHDAVYAKLTPGEFVIRKKAAQHLGPGMLEWLNHADKHMPHFSGGGSVIGWLTGSNEVNDAVKLGKKAFHFVEGALRDGFDAMWGPAIKGILSPLGSGNVPASIGAMSAAGIKSAVDDFLGKKDKNYYGSGGGIASGMHKSLIDQALLAAGVPSSGGNWAHWESGLETLVQRESAWNPRAVNRNDSNATGPIQADGAPLNSSRGLAQTVPGTFDTYHVPGTSGDIYDPIANLAAAIRYIIHTYGDISFVQQANPNMPPKGYNSGGFVMPDFGAGFAMPAPIRYAASSPGRLSQAAQALGHSRAIGLNVETMNINNPVRETAGQSVQRQLVKNRTYAGRG